jgi:5,10-methylenetetrahydrofolate reductase
MAQVVDPYHDSDSEMVVIADFTPPRSGDVAALERAGMVSADFMCAAYNPGKLVRMDSITAAYAVKERSGRDVAFNLATRDMNRVAMQSHLLGAHALGLENVIVVQGDAFTEREREHVEAVDDFTTTGLLSAIRAMNQGLDYRGSKLRAPTQFCIGATLDLGRDPESEARLTHRKVEAGAQFFITQPFFDPAQRERFLELYQTVAKRSLAEPVFWGVQVLERDGIVLGPVPSHLRQELEQGRSGVEIALELLKALAGAGVRGVYLVPPIMKGGARDYDAAQQVLQALGR